ncbi:putative hydro-lyase [Biomaibacter acetigenes]|uniref:Putative hydro-lyase D2962_15905 n=1 Tax=Biomaibacter acetigenes TaxID=2316383 RepID=A0A3G2R8T4_9FIRM|nr:putative hydro-lyase [Biomaibacter acetigenes]AYO31890.1 putative hydro-lyase [Biomaibacter acetigenes]
MDVKNDLSKIGANDARKLIRERKWSGPTCGLALGYTQANLVILPKELAYDFLLFAYRNPKPCPILDVTDIGSHEPRGVAPGADLRTDIPKYRIYRKGQLELEVNDITSYWRDDFVAFLLGCSFTFEKALLENDIPVRHIEQGRNVPMYITSIQTRPAGVFRGNMVVSMRPIPQDLVIRAVQVTSRFPAVHGAPVHIGEPSKIGIKSLDRPDFGDAVEIRDGEVPMFWACGVTPQAVAMKSKPEIMITHSPGHMFITDVKDEQLSVF